MENNNDFIFNNQTSVAPLGLVVMAGARELGDKIDSYLVRWAHHAGMDVDTFQIECECPRFSSGDGKGLIRSTVRGKDLYIVVDVGNYSIEYAMFGKMTAMSPDDHFQDLKRIIQAASGKAHRINIIMPILYGGRQHRRNYRESLDCACALQELERMGVSNIITVDAHDPRVHNAVPLMGVDNVMPSYQVLKTMFKRIKNLDTTPDKFMVISPDEGALSRNMYYASELHVPMGMFYKRRDYSRLINGRNPIVAHEYLGNSVKGKDIFIADDIISSGESMLDIALAVKKMGANRVFCYATYGLFVEGLSSFDKAYREGTLDAVLCTNLTYRTAELLSREWFIEVDCSKYIAYFIASLNQDVSISNVMDPNTKIEALMEKRNIKEN